MGNKVVQYYHGNERTGYQKGEQFTAMVHVPTKDELFEKIKSFDNEITIIFGLVKVHPADYYNKSIGRKKVSKYCKATKFNIENIKMLENMIYVTLYSKDVRIMLELKKNRQSVYFTEAYQL